MVCRERAVHPAHRLLSARTDHPGRRSLALAKGTLAARLVAAARVLSFDRAPSYLGARADTATLLAQICFPAARNKFPVLSSREFGRRGLDPAWFPRTGFRLQRPKSTRFPVNFPVSREARTRDGFARVWPLRHP